MTTEQQTRYWVFKTVADKDRSYQSISGYNDDLTSHYEYDSNVPNSKQVKENDVAVLVDKERILGIAKILEITRTQRQKEIKKCPVCGSSNIETRKTKLPKYRCNKGHDFNEYTTVVQDVSVYTSKYNNSFAPVRSHISVYDLRPYFHRRYNRNLSIQSLSQAFVQEKLPELLQTINQNESSLKPTDALTEEEPLTTYTPDDNDERKNIQRQIKARRGQTKFRNNLRKYYGDVCMVTGCKILDIIEAAHINPYRGDKDNHVQNGLLLRSDIHTLFDLNLIGIDPKSLVIHVHQSIRSFGYENFHNTQLNQCAADRRPSEEALRLRWVEFQSVL